MPSLIGASLPRLTIMDQARVRLILRPIKVNVGHHARVMLAAAANHGPGRVQKLIADRLKLTKPPPYAHVRRLAREPALLPQFVRRLIPPRLNVNLPARDERDGRKLPMTRLPLSCVTAFKIASLPKIVPDPSVPLDQLHGL